MLYPTVRGDAGTDLKRTPKFTLKADGAAASVPEGTTFALGANAPAGASVDMATGHGHAEQQGSAAPSPCPSR